MSGDFTMLFWSTELNLKTNGVVFSTGTKKKKVRCFHVYFQRRLENLVFIFLYWPIFDLTLQQRVGATVDVSRNFGRESSRVHTPTKTSQR